MHLFSQHSKGVYVCVLVSLIFSLTLYILPFVRASMSGARQRDASYWRGMCVCGCLAEDNARFILLAFVLAGYMLAGAALFQKLEGDVELRQSAEFWRVYHTFRRNHLHRSPIAVNRLHELLYAYGNATAAGLINKRRRWDFPGSFNFVGTIVSTIGYGNTTPQTTAGRIAVVIYGFFGCSGGILFFNLFLERIITLLAWVLRSIHLRRLKYRCRKESLRRASRISSNQKDFFPETIDDEENESLDQWKPSVYWVMFYLSLFSCIITCCAAAVYRPMEDWNYLDAIYFCFVSFATIGFGDFVSTQKPNYPYVHWYRFVNFLFLVIGCCCTYSLFNVTSIVIKQGLIYITDRFSCQNRKMAAPHLPRRKSSVSGMYYSKRRLTKIVARDSFPSTEGVRRTSGELISMKDFLSANQISLAVMQKQLQETAQTHRTGYPITNTPPNQHRVNRSSAVGPLAIASEKFGTKRSTIR